MGWNGSIDSIPWINGFRNALIVSKLALTSMGTWALKYVSFKRRR